MLDLEKSDSEFLHSAMSTDAYKAYVEKLCARRTLYLALTIFLSVGAFVINLLSYFADSLGVPSAIAFSMAVMFACYTMHVDTKLKVLKLLGGTDSRSAGRMHD